MKFATITEGASEHKVIKHLLARYFREQDPIINAIQPKLGNGKQQNTGGWVEVLKYCESPEIRNILIENDYLIIQIDTDQSEKKPFDVKHSDVAGQPLEPAILLENVRQRLKALIPESIYAAHSHRIFFAICIHTVECWLLPAFNTSKELGKTRDCIDLLNPVLRKNTKGKVYIPAKDKNSPTAIRAYEFILQELRSKKDIEAAATHNAGFKDFMDGLAGIGPGSPD